MFSNFGIPGSRREALQHLESVHVATDMRRQLPTRGCLFVCVPRRDSLRLGVQHLKGGLCLGLASRGGALAQQFAWLLQTSTREPSWAIVVAALVAGRVGMSCSDLRSARSVDQ